MGKKSLNELDSAELLSSAGINMVKSVVLTEGSDATLKQTAEDLGFPRVEMDERRHQHGSNQTAQKIPHGLL